MSEQRGVVVFADPLGDPERAQAEAAAAQLGVALRIATNTEDLAGLLPEATVLVTQRTPIGGDLLATAPQLRQMQVLEYGSPPVDREVAAARGIEVLDVTTLSLLGVA